MTKSTDDTQRVSQARNKYFQDLIEKTLCSIEEAIYSDPKLETYCVKCEEKIAPILATLLAERGFSVCVIFKGFFFIDCYVKVQLEPLHVYERKLRCDEIFQGQVLAKEEVFSRSSLKDGSLS